MYGYAYGCAGRNDEILATRDNLEGSHEPSQSATYAYFDR